MNSAGVKRWACVLVVLMVYAASSVSATNNATRFVAHSPISNVSGRFIAISARDATEGVRVIANSSAWQAGGCELQSEFVFGVCRLCFVDGGRLSCIRRNSCVIDDVVVFGPLYCTTLLNPPLAFYPKQRKLVVWWRKLHLCRASDNCMRCHRVRKPSACFVEQSMVGLLTGSSVTKEARLIEAVMIFVHTFVGMPQMIITQDPAFNKQQYEKHFRVRYNCFLTLLSVINDLYPEFNCPNAFNVMRNKFAQAMASGSTLSASFLNAASAPFVSQADPIAFARTLCSSNTLQSALKLATLAYLLVTVKQFDLADFEHVFTAVSESSSANKALDAFAQVTEHISVLSRACKSYYETGSFTDFLRVSGDHLLFVDEVNALLLRSNMVNLELAPLHNVSALQQQACVLQQKGQSLLKVVSARHQFAVKNALSRLEVCIVELKLKSQSVSFRSAPFSLLLYGDSGVGKSTLYRIILDMFSQRNMHMPDPDDAPLDHSRVYIRDSTEAYHTRYQNSSWAYVMDDLASKKPNSSPDWVTSLQDVICVSNNVPFFPPMASLTDKGNVCVAPYIFIATTNVKNLHAHAFASSTPAILRRFPYVLTPVVKSQYAEGTRLNPAAIGSARDLWDICIERVVPTNAGEVRYECIANIHTLAELEDWLLQATQDHFINQKALLRSIKQSERSVCCIACGRSSHTCTCNMEMQSNDAFVVRTVFSSLMSCLQFVFFVLSVACSIICCLAILPARRIAEHYHVGYLFELAYQMRVCHHWAYMFNLFVRRWYLSWLDFAVSILMSFRRTYLWFANRRYRLVIAVLGLVATVAVAAVLFSHVRTMYSQAIEDDGEIEAPVVPNVWQRSTRDATDCVTDPMRSIRPDDFRARVCGNLARLRYFDANNTIPTQVGVNALFVRGTYALVPKHWLRQVAGTRRVFTVEIRYSRNLRHAADVNVVRSVVCMDSVYFHESGDHALVKFENVNKFADITKYFVDSTGVSSKFRDEVHLFGFTGSEFTDQTGSAHYYVLPAISGKNGMRRNVPGILGTFAKPTVQGDCGSVYCVSSAKRNFIVATHTAGNDAQCFGEVVDTEWLLGMLDGLPVVDLVSSVSAMHEQSTSVVELHKKSPYRWLVVGGPGVEPVVHCSDAHTLHGGVNFRRAFKSQLRKNCFALFWEQHGLGSKKVVPYFNAEVPSWQPIRAYFKNVICDHMPIDPGALRDCVMHYFARFQSVDLSYVRVLSEFEALNGVVGDPMINAMDWSTSMGPPRNGSKYNHLPHIEYDGQPAKILTSTLKDSVSDMRSDCINGILPGFWFTSNFKDEPISLEKVAIGKVRIFQCMNFEGLFLVRQYCLSLFALFQTYNFTSEMAVGMDPHCDDWNDIRAYLEFGRPFAGDYSNFDQHMSSQIMEAAGQVMLLLCQAAGYSDGDLRIVSSLCAALAHPKVDVFGDLYRFNGSNPSGNPGTVVFNSIVNSLYMRLAWHMQHGNLDEFDANVRLITYGDDNIVSSKRQSFNLISVSNSLKDIGVFYTDAAKTSQLVTFHEWHEVTFLKRTFVDCDGVCLSPLALESLTKSLVWGRDSSTTSEVIRLANVLDSFMLESFMLGHETYERHKFLALQAADKFGLNAYLRGGWVGCDWFALLLERKSKVSRRFVRGRKVAHDVF